MVLDAGELIHVIERRRFEGDVRRHFAGRVEQIEGPLARVSGFTYGFNPGLRRFELRDQLRTRVISLSDNALIVNVLPATVDPARLVYRWREDERLYVAEGPWEMELSEFVWKSS